MNGEYQPSDELVKLLIALTEDGLDDEKRVRLGEIVGSDAQERDYYVQYVSLHGMLETRHGQAPVLELPLAEPGEMPPRRSSAAATWAALAVAAGLLLAIGLGAYMTGVDKVEPGPGPVAPIATIFDAENVRWEDDEGAGTGDTLPTGRRRLASGVARLKLKSGVIVAVRGPAEFELHDGNRFHLHRGVVRAYTPPEAVGFIVNAPGVEVVDLGTEFGVSVSKADDVEVHVFQGKVRLNVQVDLRAGEALRIDHKQKAKKVKLARQTFPPIER